MHYTNALVRGIFALAILTFCFTSCDLPVQPDFEFEPELGELITFEDMTVLEWMRSEGAVSSSTNNNFDSLVLAIELTGLEEEYNDPSDRRTFLMLNNSAFKDGGEILAVLRVDGLNQLDEEGLERLRTILRYHIIDSYVDQGPEALPVLATDYLFQTLIPGPDGRISVKRDERFRLEINRSIELPGTKRGTQVRNHNYIFSNGVGHQIRDYVRTRPY